MKNILILFSLLFISNLVVAQDSNFEIKFKSGNFTPEPTVDFQSRLKAQFNENRLGYIYRLVQFNSIPTETDKQKIKASGISLISFISNKAYVARIEKNLAISNWSDLKIRSIDFMKPRFKISPELTLSLIHI